MWAELTCPHATHLHPTMARGFRLFAVKSAALTRHELEALVQIVSADIFWFCIPKSVEAL